MSAANTSTLESAFAGLIALAERVFRSGRVPLTVAGAPVELFIDWRGEQSDFVRFNHARVRQAGTVEVYSAELRLIAGQRMVTGRLTTSSDAAVDRVRVEQMLDRLSHALTVAAVDPHLLVNHEPATSRQATQALLPDERDLVNAVDSAAANHDLVGAYMAGPMASGLWSSSGHRHYFERSGWSFDYSIYARSEPGIDRRDKAVKATIAQTDWNPALLHASITQSLQRHEVLHRPARTLSPGMYRALLAPAAVSELLDMMQWGGFSARNHLTGQSPLSRLRTGESSFSEQVHLAEDLAATPAPRFQSDGFVRPLRTELVRAGKAADWFCSPRTSREFNIATNFAGGSEGALALDLSPGSLGAADELAALDEGLAISNLWYLNFSDLQQARVTGMTRFATFWVENGQWVAPITPLRFDDTLFSLLGTQLLALGKESAWLPNLSSYDFRVFGGNQTPGALIGSMRFAL